MAVQRPEIVVSINGNICGDNWLSFTENPNAQIKNRKFINKRNETSTVTRYSTQWSFECLLDCSCPEIAAIYNIAMEQRTGDDAIVEVTVTDTVNGISRTFEGTVQVTSIDDDDDMIIKGTIYANGGLKEEE